MSLAVELDHCTLRYGERSVLEDVSLKIDAGRFACIIGSSGSGKSTLLALISGLLAPATGEVRVGGQPVAGTNPRVQLVFQSGALFDWMTVRENVEFGLRATRVPDEVTRGEVEGYLRLVGLDDVAGARIHQLSGGMAQRVAIARALVMQPQVLLMDEPFSALDAITRDNLQVELIRLWEETEVTVVFVTHNLREAILLGDDICLLGSGGHIERTWEVKVPRSQRAHHPALRPLENELRERLHVAHPGYERPTPMSRTTVPEAFGPGGVGYFPVYLDLAGKSCLVLGGGAQAAEKARGLAAARGDVTVVAPAFEAELVQLGGRREVRLLAHEFTESDLDGVELVIDASLDEALGRRVSEAARRRRVLVNVLDRPALCDFIAPALVQRGALQLAISTGGRSPFMAGHVRRVLEETIGPEWGELVEMVGEVRDRLRHEGVPLRRQNEIYARVPGSGALELLRRGLRDEARQALESCVSTPTSA